MDEINVLLRDSRFWGAVVALINVVLFTLAPDFPKPIWVAVDGLLAVVIGTLATRNAVAQGRALRAARAGKWAHPTK